MNLPRSFRAARLLLAALSMVCLALSTAFAYTPPSPPPKYWDYFNDLFFSLANRSAANGSLILTTTGATQATSTSGNTAFQQQYEILANLDDWTYRIINRDSGLCLAPLNGGTTAGTPLAAVAYTGAANQRWLLTGTGGGYWTFVHAATGLAMQTDGGSPAKVTLQGVNTALTQQQWLADPANPVDHFPKKGQCGWDGTVWSFQPNWFYNWSASQPGLPAQTNYIPMKAQRYWPGTGDLGGGYAALHSNPRPVAVLGFNEPDHTDQANMTTDQAIAGWLELQNLNVPLGSPAAASTWGGWMSDFYNKIGSNGYRVDFTAIHNYPTDPWNLDSYLSNVNSVAGNWNRPVWITEFALTGWGSNVSWTEENCYTWLAEFLWRAEDYPNLRRYSYYAYANDPPANPWNPIGTGAGGLLRGDNSTLTNLGELYAAWDADRSIKARTAYMLQGKQSMMRLSSSMANSPFPATQYNYLNAVSIRNSTTQTQWALVASPTAGQYYITSLLDGRRLQTDGKLVVFAPPGTTGATVQWQIAPDSKGYFFINNLATSTTLYSQRNNDGNGAPTAAWYGVVASGNATDLTRFRLVKPLYPAAVPTAAPAAPTGITVTPGDRRNVIRWTGTGPFYTVSRATSPTGAYTVLATNWPNSTYVDNAVANGTTYYYTVTSANVLADTSAVSAPASSTPNGSLAVATLEGNYKFEAGSAFDTSGNAESGAVLGNATFFSPGKVDSSAVTFNGVDSYLQLPAVVANDFSLAFWMRSTSAGGTGSAWYNGSGLADAEVGGTTSDYGVSLLGGKIAFGVGGPDVTITSSNAVNDGAWHHVVATRNGTTGAMQIFVDGTLRSTGTGATGTRAAPTGIRLGAIQSGGGYYKGDLDEVRLYGYVLAPADVAKLAGSNTNALVGQYNLAGGTAQDGSGFGNQGTASNITASTPGKVNASAASFNGSTSYAQIPQSLVNDFTVAFWVKTTGIAPTGTQWWQGLGLVDGEVSGSFNDFGLSLLGSKVCFGVGNADTSIVSTSSVNDGTWYHVAATRTGSNGTMRLYVNGVLQATGTGPLGPRTDSPALAIGRLLPGYNYFRGQMDDIRLYNYALSGTQIQSMLYPVPSPWTAQDIGNPGAAGAGSYQPNVNGGTWTVAGSGADIWSTSDQFGFVSTAQSGAGTLITRLAALPVNQDGTTTANSKAGLMWRDGTAANASYVDLVFTTGQGLQFTYRNPAGATAVQPFNNVALSAAPIWLKMTRGGNYFQAFYSTKAGQVPPTTAEWKYLGNCTVPFTTGNAQAGLAVTSHQDGTVASAAFDNFALLPNTPPVISSLGDQTIAQNTSTWSLGVALSDAESLPNSLTLTGSSSNPQLLPASGIGIDGSNGNYGVQLTPAANQAGAAVVTLTASDGQNTSTMSFNLVVTTSAAGGWRETYFGSTANSGQGADSANPSGDGISNYWKRAFGLNPLVAVASPSSVWPQASVNTSAGTLNLGYTRAASANVPDLTYQVLWSSDLQTWSSNGVTDSVISTDGNAGTETHQATVPLSLGNRVFLKLQVTRN